MEDDFLTQMIDGLTRRRCCAGPLTKKGEVIRDVKPHDHSGSGEV